MGASRRALHPRQCFAGPRLALAALALLLPLLLACGSPPTNPTSTAARESNVVIRRVSSSPALQGRPAVELEVRSDRPFPVRNEIVVLRIGAREFLLSRYPDSGDTHVLIFTLTPEEFAATSQGDLVRVQYGTGEQPDRWDLGPLDKTPR